MAYIPKAAKNSIDVSPIGNCQLGNDKELTYAILCIIKQYVKQHANKAAEAVGSLESAKQELYRIHIIPETKQSEFDHGE